VNTRILFLSLMATTAFSTVAVAQSAQTPAVAPNAATPAVTPAPLAPAKPVAAATPAPAAAPKAAPVASPPKPAAKPVDFGSVSAPEPVKQTVPVAQPGLTASPTDFAAAQDKAKAANAPTGTTLGAAATAATGSGRPTSLGGVTGTDVGGGYMIKEEAKKTRSTVTRDAIDKQSPTANPYQLINLLPGVVQSSTDNTGLNGGNIRLRGFNSDHIGFTIEGAPVNDSGNYALYPQEYVDAENIGQISIAQGSPDLDSPHVGATGGVINLYAIDPSKQAGVLVDYSFGSNDLSRSFVRINSGQVGNVRAFLSYSRLDQDHWGDNLGTDRRNHIDFKMVADISPGNTVRLSAIYNDAINNFYPNPTLAQFNTNSGYLFNQIPRDRNNYQYRINPFKNLILSAPSNFTITEKLKFDTVPYYWYGFGNGGGVASAPTAWGNLRVTVPAGTYYNPSITETHRPGVINKFTLTEGNHQFVAGHWFEYANHKQTGGFTPLNADGTISDVWGDSRNISPTVCRNIANVVVPCPAGAIQKRDVLTTTMTNMFFVGDTWKFAPKWSADFGVKHIVLNREVEDNMPGAPKSKNTLDETATLPTIGVKYKWNDENQVFASIGTSFRSAPNFNLTPNYSSSSTTIPAVKIPEPETGITYEIGHRYQGPMFATSVSGFLGRYENFQQNTSGVDPNTGTRIGSQFNVGGLMNYGINAEIGTAPINHFRPYISAELLRTEMLDNIQTLTTANTVDFLKTKGKTLVGAPEYQVGLGLDYDNGHLFANVAYKYIGEQYSTFLNDEKIDAFGRLDMSVGYRFKDIAQLKQPEIKLSLFNVLNSRDLTGVSGFQNNAKATTGVNGGTINASGTPSYYLGQDFSFMVTLRAGL